MISLAGLTVQCLNPECVARGRWVRMQEVAQENCAACGAPMHTVPRPLQPRFRTRARAMGNYRPRLMGRAR